MKTAPRGGASVREAKVGLEEPPGSSVLRPRGRLVPTHTLELSLAGCVSAQAGDIVRNEPELC